MNLERVYRDQYDAGWLRIKQEMEQLEPVHRALVSHVVKRYLPDATKLVIEASDQSHGGWVVRAAHDANGPIDDIDVLYDSDELHELLTDFGEWFSSWDHPSPQDFELNLRA